MNISVSSIQNAVNTVFSNFFSRGRVQDFFYMLCSICIWGGIWGLYALFLRALSSFLNNHFYVQHFRATVLGGGLGTSAEVCF